MKTLVLLLLLFLAGGCAEYVAMVEHNKKIDEDRRKWVERYSTPEMKKAIAERRVWIGMHKVEVLVIFGRRPYKPYLCESLTTMQTASGVSESWRYCWKECRECMTIYFSDDIVTRIFEHR